MAVHAIVTIRFWRTSVLCRRCWLEHLRARVVEGPGREPAIWCPRCDR